MAAGTNTQVLIMADAGTDAEQVINLLRRTGLAVQACKIRTPGELQEQLDKRQWDLLLLVTALDLLATMDLRAWLRQTDKDIPVILLCPDFPAAESWPRLREYGIDEVLAMPDPEAPLFREQLSLSVIRELGNLKQRRARRRLAISFRELEKRYQHLLASAAEAICYLQDGVHVYANKAYMELFAYETVEDMVSIPLLDLVAEAELSTVRQFLAQQQKASATCSFHALRRDGSLFKATMEIADVPYEGQRALQVIIRPASGNPELQNAVRAIHHRDLLTGLLNSNSILGEIELAISDAVYDNRHASVLLLQLHYLDEVMLVAGRSAANLLLADIGSLLSSLLPQGLVAGRVAANELVILLPASNNSDRIQLLVADFNRGLLPLVPGNLRLLARYGLAAVNGEASDAGVIIDRARRNLLQREHDQQLATNGSEGFERMEVLPMLRKALAEERFVLAFQPTVSLKSDGLEHYEVRIRLRQPSNSGNRDLLHPRDFLETANQHGLGEEIDHWVIRQVLEIFRQRDNPQLRLTVNLTQNSMSSPTLLPWLAAQLHDYRQIADQLVLQISELDMVSAPDSVTGFNTRMQELNLPLSVTHFGCSLDPFRRLAAVQARYAKLDRALLDRIDVDFEQRETLQATVSGLHAQGIMVIAPMIDRIELLPLLWQANVNMVQGNCLQEPSENMNFDFLQDEEITLGSHSS